MPQPDLQREQQVERYLSEANLWRIRGEPSKAEEFAAKAVQLDPANAVAREMHGDLLQLLGELEQALAEYDEARRLAPERASAEVKFGRVTLAIAAEKARGASDPDSPEGILQRESALAEKKNPVLAFVYSLVIPGGGQFYNGEKEKAAVIFGVWIFLLLSLLAPLTALFLQTFANLTGTYLPGKGAEPGIWGIIGSLLLTAVTIYSAIEAYLVTKQRFPL